MPEREPVPKSKPIKTTSMPSDSPKVTFNINSAFLCTK